MNHQWINTYHWDSPHQWSLWLQEGPAETAYTLNTEGEKEISEDKHKTQPAFFSTRNIPVKYKF